MILEHEPITPPGARDTLQELRLPLDVLRWAPTWLTTRIRRTSRPRTVILLPGFGTSPRSMRVMESFLRRAGHRVRDWGLGRNNGEARQLRQRLVPVVESCLATHREPVTLVGWSLGGIVAWRACIDRWSPNVRHIEVSETHVGLGFSPRVLGLVAAELERR
jgi:pimeloyl-ACP methyl ester carboxylesterase